MQAIRAICWASALFSDPELWWPYLVMVATVTGGCVVFALTCRWYRTLMQPPTITGEALAQLGRAVEEQEELDPQEIQRIKEAIERQMRDAGVAK